MMREPIQGHGQGKGSNTCLGATTVMMSVVRVLGAAKSWKRVVQRLKACTQACTVVRCLRVGSNLQDAPSAPCVICATGRTVLVWCSLISLNLQRRSANVRP
jgi:hypothetical protein